MITTLIGSGQFCDIVGILPRRLDQRRLRQPGLLPIARIEPGNHSRFDAFDALRLRTVVALEAIGLDFSAACEHVRRGGIPPAVMFPSSDDLHLAIWADGAGAFRRLTGSIRDIARARPAEPSALISANLSALTIELERRAVAVGLAVVGTNFVRADQ